MKTVVGVFLVLHGLTHSILAMVPSPKTPNEGFATFFSGIGSWLLPKLSTPASRALATALAVTATLGFVAAGLALLSVVVPFGWWRALAIAAALVSLLLVGFYWDQLLIVGLLIDIVVLAVLLFTSWSPG